MSAPNTPSSERHRSDGTDFVRLCVYSQPLLAGPALLDVVPFPDHFDPFPRLRHNIVVQGMPSALRNDMMNRGTIAPCRKGQPPIPSTSVCFDADVRHNANGSPIPPSATFGHSHRQAHDRVEQRDSRNSADAPIGQCVCHCLIRGHPSSPAGRNA